MINKIIFAMLFCIGYAINGNTQLLTEGIPTFDIPDSVQNLNTESDLMPFINSPRFVDKKYACIRLGQIKGDEALDLLMDTFTKEPYRNGAVVGCGVKYYALISIGEIGGLKAEEFLRNIVLSYSPFTPRFDSGNKGDSSRTMLGAMKALMNIDPPWLLPFMDSFYVRTDRDDWGRQVAFAYTVKKYLDKNSIAIDEKINYVIDRFLELCPFPPLLAADGTVRLDNVMVFAYRQMLFDYGDDAVRLINERLNVMPFGDEKAAYLDHVAKVSQGLPIKVSKGLPAR